MFSKKRILVLTSILIVGGLAYGGWMVFRPWLFDDTDDMLAAMQIEEGDWVADIGSGEGTYTLPMAEAVGASGRVFAVDIDEAVLDTLSAKAEERGLDNVETVLGAADDPKLPPDAFDAVLVRNAYHEFTAPEQMLREIRAALKPDGRLVLLENIAGEMVDASRADQVEEHDLALRYARGELRAAGFEITREIDPLRYFRVYDVRYWMIVASPRADREAASTDAQSDREKSGRGVGQPQ